MVKTVYPARYPQIVRVNETSQSSPLMIASAHEAKSQLSKLLDDTDYEAADRAMGEIWDESLGSDR
jgi:hypothetical protein